MADYVIQKDGQTYQALGIDLTPEEYAKQLKQEGFTIVSVDGQTYVPKPAISETYEGKGLRVWNDEDRSWTWMTSVSEIEAALSKPLSAVEVVRDGKKIQYRNTGDATGGIQVAPVGGILINGLPINAVLEPGSLTPEQQKYMREVGIPEGGWGVDYRGSQRPWGDEPVDTPANGGINDPTFGTPQIEGTTLPDPERAGDITLPDPERVGEVTLPESERVGPRLGQDFDQWYANVIDAQAGNLERYYDFPTPLMPAAQMDVGGIPQPGAQTPQQFEALQFLLSGQGFDPATMSRMRAGATDAAAMVGRSQAGTARLMGQQAGLAGSPAAMALEAGARRQQGDATTRALNQIEIQNAMQGMQNLQTGAGMELDRQTGGAAMANQMALSNAANILSGMQQNVGNIQQANLTNIGNVVGQGMTQAGQQAGLYGQGAQTYNQAAMGLAGQSPFFNAAQAASAGLSQAELDRQGQMFNAAQTGQWGWNQSQLDRQRDLFNAAQAGTTGWNQAQLDRQREMFNAGNLMTRYGWDMSNLVNMANMTGGASNLYGFGGSPTTNYANPYAGLAALGSGWNYGGQG